MTLPQKPSLRAGFPCPLIFYLQATLATLQTEFSDCSDAEAVEKAQHNTKKLRNILAGLEKWQNHPAKRAILDPPTIWRSGSSKLLDYGQISSATDPDGPVVLVIPSLVNKPYILDLSPENSFLRTLSSQGIRPILLDWGSPSAVETDYDINAYIENRATAAVAFITNQTGKSVGLLGYCMGGTIAAAMAQTGSNINALSTIGAPWDFSEVLGNQLILQSAGATNNGQTLADLLQQLGHTFGAIPYEFLQFLFAALNPTQFAVKFEKFNSQISDLMAERQFTFIEDWLADCNPIAWRAARDLLLNWHVKNQIANGKWQLNKQTVDAAKINLPSLIICGQTDKIAPLPVTKPLGLQIPNAQILTPMTGHVGMITGTDMRKNIINPICSFFKRNSAIGKTN